MRRLACGFALVLVVALGCGDGDGSLRQLTAADVTPLPPGDAVGSNYAGTYLLASFNVDACRRRKGPIAICSTVQPTTATFQITQRDGVLDATGGTGRVSRDGTFSLASRETVTSNVTGEMIGESFSLTEGRFQPQPTTGRMEMAFEVETTAAALLQEGWVELDARLRIRAVRE